MAFKRIIVEELNCPRCNAWAQVRIEQERGDLCILYIVCNKCKLHKYSGITNRKIVNLQTQEKNILKKLSLINDGKITRALTVRLGVIRETIRREKLKLGVR